MDTKIIETTFLIIGGGIAGVSCAETISYLCPNESVCLITESNLIKTVTNLVPLAKSLTKFDIEEKESSSMKSITTIIDSLKFIDSENQSILTQSGRTIKYLYLCLCTGGRPKLIDSNNEYIIGIRDTDSVVDFQKRIKESKRIVVLGNGGIATEIVYEAKNILIDWVIKDSYVSSTFLDAGAAEFLNKRLYDKSNVNESKTILKRMRYSDDCSTSSSKKQSGAALGPDWHRKIDMSGKSDLTDLAKTVQIHYNTEIKTIEKISDNEFPLKVQLTNDEIIFCDFLISAIGVYPNLNFTSDKDFITNSDGGINVNEMMETNLKNIYCAGDVCHANWNYSEHWFQMRLWTQARQMGSMAGKAMAAAFSKEEIYQDFCFELFGHVTELYGKQVVLLGNFNGQSLGRDYEILLRVTPDLEYIKFIIKNGKLRGAILIGETGLEETCENLILNQIDLTPYGDDLLNPDIDIEDYFD